MTPEFEATLRAQAAVIAVFEEAMTSAQRAAFRWGSADVHHQCDHGENNFRKEDDRG